MRILVILFVFCFVNLSCDDQVEFNSPAFQAKSDGAVWKSKIRSASLNDGVLRVSGTYYDEVIEFVIPNAVVGDFELGVVTTAQATYTNTDEVVFSTRYSSATDPIHFPSEGEINITELTSDYVSGFFWFTAYEAVGLNFINFNEGVFYKIAID